MMMARVRSRLRWQDSFLECAPLMVAAVSASDGCIRISRHASATTLCMFSEGDWRGLKSLAKAGRDWQPLDMEFTTYTLRYNKMHWVTVDSLAEHWSKAHVSASIQAGEVEIGLRDA